MADTNPPDEIDNREAPADGNIDAPDARALDEEPTDGDGHEAREAKCNGEADEPTERSGASQNDGADLIRDRGVGMARPQHRREAANFGRIEWRLPGAHADSFAGDREAVNNSGLGLRTAAR